MPLFERFMKVVLFVVIYSVRYFFWVWYRPKIIFTDPSVKSTRLKEPSIIIANHTCMLDPIMLLAVFFYDRSIVVAKDQIESKEFHWALSRIKCVIPCDRYNLDTEWALIAKRHLDSGKSIIIFPEGKCRVDGLLNEFKTGFAFLARSSHVPVVSVGLDGIYKFGHRTRIVIGNAETIERVKGVASSAHLAERSEYFRQKVWELKQKALNKNGKLPLTKDTPKEDNEN